MVTLEELEAKLQNLRLKWAKDFPKSEFDPRWPSFRVDKSYALHLKLEIDKIKIAETSKVAEEIFK